MVCDRPWSTPRALECLKQKESHHSLTTPPQLLLQSHKNRAASSLGIFPLVCCVTALFNKCKVGLFVCLLCNEYWEEAMLGGRNVLG